VHSNRQEIATTAKIEQAVATLGGLAPPSRRRARNSRGPPPRYAFDLLEFNGVGLRVPAAWRRWRSRWRWPPVGIVFNEHTDDGATVFLPEAPGAARLAIERLRSRPSDRREPRVIAAGHKATERGGAVVSAGAGDLRE
jgi:hypothetical protein